MSSLKDHVMLSMCPLGTPHVNIAWIFTTGSNQSNQSLNQAALLTLYVIKYSCNVYMWNP